VTLQRLTPSNIDRGRRLPAGADVLFAEDIPAVTSTEKLCRGSSIQTAPVDRGVARGLRQRQVPSPIEYEGSALTLEVIDKGVGVRISGPEYLHGRVCGARGVSGP
jgi:hypothetical protein